MRPKSTAKEEAIRSIALQMILEEGLENLSMQRLAKAANVSPRTIYIKYENKEDLLIKLYVDETLGKYEAAVLEGFSEGMAFAEGVHKLWSNGFHFLTRHREYFAIMQYGKSSPLLNKAYQERGIIQGSYFQPIHRFLDRHAKAGTIHKFPDEVRRALLFSPVMELVSEYFDYQDRPKQLITEKLLKQACDVVIKGMLK